MKEINFKLIAQYIEFDTEEQQVDTEILTEHSFYSSRIKSNDLEVLFQELMEIKNDWLTYTFDENEMTISIIITLSYPYCNGNRDIKIPTEIFELTEKFVQSKKDFIEGIKNDDDDSNNTEQGFLIKIGGREEGIFNVSEIEQNLREANIEFDIITNKVKRSEAGAGDLLVEAIIFIKDSIASGIAWDIIKPILLMGAGAATKNLFQHRTDTVNFKRLKKDVAMRCNSKTKEVLLFDMFKDESKNEYCFIFKVNNLDISILCDENYNIKEYSTNIASEIVN